MVRVKVNNHHQHTVDPRPACGMEITIAITQDKDKVKHAVVAHHPLMTETTVEDPECPKTSEAHHNHNPPPLPPPKLANKKPKTRTRAEEATAAVNAAFPKKDIYVPINRN